MYLVENYNVIFRILIWFSKYCQFDPIWPWIPKYHFLIVYMLSMQTVAVRIWESNIGLLSLWHLDQFDCEGEVSYFKSLFGTLLFRLIIDLEDAGKCKLHFTQWPHSVLLQTFIRIHSKPFELLYSQRHTWSKWYWKYNLLGRDQNFTQNPNLETEFQLLETWLCRHKEKYIREWHSKCF